MLDLVGLMEYMLIKNDKQTQTAQYIPQEQLEMGKNKMQKLYAQAKIDMNETFPDDPLPAYNFRTTTRWTALQ